MMVFVFALVLLVGVFLLAVLGTMVLSLMQREELTMQDSKALVFEVYRYAVCFVMVLLFGVTAYALIAAALVDWSNAAALAAPAVGVILSGLLFLLHWKMKKPLAA